MRLVFLTNALPKECKDAGMWVEQEGEEVYLRRGDEVEPLAQFKGADFGTYYEFLAAASRAVRGVATGISYERK